METLFDGSHAKDCVFNCRWQEDDDNPPAVASATSRSVPSYTCSTAENKMVEENVYKHSSVLRSVPRYTKQMESDELGYCYLYEVSHCDLVFRNTRNRVRSELALSANHVEGNSESIPTSGPTFYTPSRAWPGNGLLAEASEGPIVLALERAKHWMFRVTCDD